MTALAALGCGGSRSVGTSPLDGGPVDAVAPVLDDAGCASASVSHVEPNDAAGLPQGSCIAPASAVCTSAPRVTLSCPVVRGPADSGTIAPGDTISVGVLMTSTVDLPYPCFGLTADHDVQTALPAVTIYALKPSQDYPLWFSAVLPASIAPGTVVHFVAYVVLSPCPGDTGALEFDVTVG
jgi:hypothetical protein